MDFQSNTCSNFSPAHTRAFAIVTSIELEHQFHEAMRQGGVHTTESILADGQLHRVHIEGDKPGSKNGWYVLHADGVPAGCFGSSKTGRTTTWCAKERDALSALEQTEFEAKIRAAKIKQQHELDERHQHARSKAAQIWDHPQAKCAPADHPYLIAKGVNAHGVKRWRDMLVVPVRDAGGTLHSLQLISADGQKRFLTGGEITGHFHLIGDLGEVLNVAEGYATAATIHEVTGQAVAAAFNAGNRKPVAKSLRRKYSNLKMVICADDDQWTEGNPGMTKGKEAADAIDGAFISPRFADTRAKPTDFNDLAALEGHDVVKAQLACATEAEAVAQPLPLTRHDLEAMIENENDFDELTGPLARKVTESGLSHAAKDYLRRRHQRQDRNTVV